jgi:hypothetical protein
VAHVGGKLSAEYVLGHDLW